ncbi:MAG: hypothetical protein WDM90_19345 [Ferruginibacter sp.]
MKQGLDKLKEIQEKIPDAAKKMQEAMDKLKEATEKRSNKPYNIFEKTSPQQVWGDVFLGLSPKMFNFNYD